MTDVFQQWPACIFAVDPGDSPGWACMWGAQLVCSGHSYSTMRMHMEEQYTKAKKLKIPFVLFIEGFSRHGKWGWKQALGTERQAAKVMFMAEDIGIPKRRVLRAEPAARNGGWHRVLRPKRRDESWKDVSMEHVGNEWNFKPHDDNQADAICMAEFVSKWGKVRSLMPKRIRESHV